MTEPGFPSADKSFFNGVDVLDYSSISSLILYVTIFSPTKLLGFCVAFKTFGACKMFWLTKLGVLWIILGG